MKADKFWEKVLAMGRILSEKEAEETHKTLYEMKNEKESFSQAVLRLTRKKKSVMSLEGIVKNNPAFTKGLKKAVKERDKGILRTY